LSHRDERTAHNRYRGCPADPLHGIVSQEQQKGTLVARYRAERDRRSAL
jgi:hypothetical protein